MDRYIFLGILFVFTVAALVLFAVDFFYFCGIAIAAHIGRWKSTEEWEKRSENSLALVETCTPTVKITDNSRYMLLDILKGKYRSGTIQSWQKAALILGLLESRDTQEVSAAKAAAGKLLNEDGTWRKSLLPWTADAFLCRDEGVRSKRGSPCDGPYGFCHVVLPAQKRHDSLYREASGP